MDPDYHCQFSSLAHLSPRDSKLLFYYLINDGSVPKGRCGRALFYMRKLCFCCCYIPCPPLPSSITNKVAFPSICSTYKLVSRKCANEPIPGSYTLEYAHPGLKQLIFDSCLMSEFIRKKVTNSTFCYYINPTNFNVPGQLACYYIKHIGDIPSSFVLMICHGNAGDLGLEWPHLAYTSWRLSCDVFMFDYTGFGQSCTGHKATAEQILDDVEAAYHFLVNNLGVPSCRIILFGCSLGTVAAIHMASKGVKIAGLVLDGLFMSALSIFFPEIRNKVCIDKFVSFDKVPKIVCPVLIVHGGDDDVTDIQNIRHFLELCKTAVPPLIIPGGGHLALGVYRAYWNRMEYFISTELRLGPTMYVYRCGLGCPKIVHSEQDTNSIHETYIGLKTPDLTKLI